MTRMSLMSRPPIPRAVATAAAVLAVAVAPAASAANLVLNGDFEAPGPGVTDWTTEGFVATYTGADYSLCCGTTGSEPAYTDNHFVGFGAANMPGPLALSQSFATVVGATYLLRYQSGALGQPADQQITVAPIGDSPGETVDNFADNDMDTTFATHGLTFRATDALTTLIFSVQTAGPDDIDAILDNVSVVRCEEDCRVDVGGGVPEPAAWALMLLGFAAAGALLRRRAGPGPACGV